MTLIGHNGPLIETQPKLTSGYHWLQPTLLSLNWPNKCPITNLALNYPLPLAPADSVLSLPALKTEQKSLAPTAVTTLSHIACHPLSADLILPSYLQPLWLPPG